MKATTNALTRKHMADALIPFNVSMIQIQGDREYQEDRFSVTAFEPPFNHLFLFVIADGHGGDRCSEFVVKKFPQTVQDLLVSKAKTTTAPKLKIILQKAITATTNAWNDYSLGKDVRSTIQNESERILYFKGVDQETFHSDGKDSGTTLVAALYDHKRKNIHVVNLGDSRCALWVPEIHKLNQTVDHSVGKKLPAKCDNPGFNGFVKDGRLCSDLAMSSSIGDNTPELLGIVSTAANTYTWSNMGTKSTMVIASDGLWDNYTTQEVFLDTRENAKEFIDDKGGAQNFGDNTTVIMVEFSE